MAEGSTDGRSKRLGKMSTANMLRSLLPLVVIVLGLAYFCTPHNVDPVTEIDPSDSIRYAASLSDVPLPVPMLADTWRPTSVAVDAPPDAGPGPLTLTIGYVTPTEEFAKYVVSTDSASVAISDLLTDADTAGRITLAGQSWEEFTTSRGERLYLRTDGDLRLLVTGSASEDEVRTLIESLAPYRG